MDIIHINKLLVLSLVPDLHHDEFDDRLGKQQQGDLDDRNREEQKLNPRLEWVELIDAGGQLPGDW